MCADAEYTQQNGRIRTGSVNVAWTLHSVTEEDGGFVVVPCATPADRHGVMIRI